MSRSRSGNSRAWYAVLLMVMVLIAGILTAGPAAATATANPAWRHHHHHHERQVVAYYQTQYVTEPDGTQQYVSPRPLRGIATVVDVAAVHLNNDGSVHLNDDPPSAPKFTRMWRDLRALQHSGTKVIAMLGGAGVGSFANLHSDFGRFYPLLTNLLRTYHFDGIDLDIEEPFSLADTEHLINRLRKDFGPRFIITLAPVASDLSGQTTFSGGFSYAQLESNERRNINWYNAQFYCGWGDLRTTTAYEKVVANGFAPSRVVAGTVTNPANCTGYVQPANLRDTVRALAKKYPSFGGVAGWEYFNSLGPVPGQPQSWYRFVAQASR